MKEKLIAELQGLADMMPPICDRDRPATVLIFDKPVTVYCKPFEQFQDVLRRAAEALADDGVPAQKWIPVTERLPDNKEHDWVLAQVVEDNGFMHIPKVMEYRQQKNDWYEETYGWLSEHNGAFTVTHWMPLPERPKGE